MTRELRRSLGLIDFVSIVMGAIVGVGVFFTPGGVARTTGSSVLCLTAWLLGGLIAIAGSLTFAELGARFPRTGGQYLVLRDSWGRLVAFLYCWSLLCVIHTGAIAIIAIICVDYMARMFGVALASGVSTTAACILIAALTAINVRGARSGARLAVVTTASKIVTLTAIAGIALVLGGSPEAPVPPRPTDLGDGSWLLLFPALVHVLFSYGGWQQGLYLAGEVKRPQRVVPMGITLGVAGVAALYLAVNWGYLRLLGVEGVASSTTLAADAVGAAVPGAAERVAAAAVSISAFGVASVGTMTAPRMYKAMADDGSFFPVIARVHSTFATPWVAIILQGAIAMTMVCVAGADGIDYLTTGVVCIDWVFFFLTGASLFVLRRREASIPVEGEEVFRVPLYPIIPAAFCLAAACAIVGAFMGTSAIASVVATAVMVTGILAFFLFRRRFGRTRDVSPRR